MSPESNPITDRRLRREVGPVVSRSAPHRPDRDTCGYTRPERDALCIRVLMIQRAKPPSPHWTRVRFNLPRSARIVPSESQSLRRGPGLIALRSSERFTSLRACGLNRRARYRTVRAEDATVARLRTQHRSARGALVEEFAGVGRHRLSLRRPADRTRDRGFRDHAGPSLFFASCAPRRGACGPAQVGTPRRGRSHL